MLFLAAAPVAANVSAAGVDAKQFSTTGGCAGEPTKTLHPPIEISGEVGEDGFVLADDPRTGEPIHRPGSGVVDGQGTAEDPYVIEGWCIPSTWPETDVGISIERTDAHVEIRNVTVTGLGPVPDAWGSHGIRMQYVTNVAVVDTDIERTYRNGVWIDESERIEIVNTTVSDSRKRGLNLIHTDEVTVRDSRVTRSNVGVLLSTSTDTLIEGSMIAHQSSGVRVVAGSDGATLRGTTIADHDEFGVKVTETDDVRMEDNVVTGNVVGVHFGIPVETADASQNGIVQGNDFHGNGDAGLAVYGQGVSLDARNNWWGATSGPSGGVEDACTDAVADGSGDEIRADDAEVCFDPWLGHPPP